VSPAVAATRDRDRDGLPDRWERRHQLPTSRASANADPDGDRVDNRNELREGSDPRLRDTDRNRTRDGREDSDEDGLSNAAEDAYGHDPDDPDTDNDGVIDGREHAGVVRSFTGRRLVIALAGGGTVEARVGDETDIGCGTEAEVEEIQDREPGSEPGDPTEEELESEEIGDDEAIAEDGDDGDRAAYDVAEPDDGPLDGSGADDLGDASDSEFQDDEHDFEDVCPARRLRRGERVREASRDGAGFDEVELIRAR
jgi:hypothetical protein